MRRDQTGPAGPAGELHRGLSARFADWDARSEAFRRRRPVVGGALLAVRDALAVAVAVAVVLFVAILGGA